jgi:hypothetical protein
MIGRVSLGWVSRAATVAVLIGAFGTWRTAGPVSLDGLEGPHDGWLAVLFALVALVGAGSLGRRRLPGTALVLGCGAAVVYFTVRNLVDDGAVFGGSAGWGIWLTIVAGGALVTAPVVAVARRVRG